MITFTAKEAKNRLGEVFRAAESDTVEITNHGKPVVRVLSIGRSMDIDRTHNSHDVLDSMKHRLSCEVLSRFSVNEIRDRAMENLDRWRSQGTWSKSYDEWLIILKSPDDRELISSMVGTDQRSNRLRQSMPYVGLLDQSIVRRIHEEVGS